MMILLEGRLSENRQFTIGVSLVDMAKIMIQTMSHEPWLCSHGHNLQPDSFIESLVTAF
jgi:hypothetical protein